MSLIEVRFILEAIGSAGLIPRLTEARDVVEAINREFDRQLPLQRRIRGVAGERFIQTLDLLVRRSTPPHSEALSLTEKPSTSTLATEATRSHPSSPSEELLVSRSVDLAIASSLPRPMVT